MWVSVHNVLVTTTVLRSICRQGADPNAIDNDSLTPLLLAATKKAWNAVDLLLQRKPDLTKRDTRGRNILHLMIMNGGSLDRMSVCLCNRVSCERLSY